MSPQQPINLLPDSVRKQCELGARTGQLIGSILAGILIVVVLATQSRIQLDRERHRHATVMEEAAAVHEAQREASRLSSQLRTVRSYIQTYESLALPLDISAIIATVINELPPSITIETLDMEASNRRPPRTGRGVPGETGQPQRMLVGELSGFALTEDDIARLVMRLQNREGFQDVKLDFSRTRVVRDRTAREFRLSFRIDLGRPYDIIEAGLASAELPRQHTEALR